MEIKTFCIRINTTNNSQEQVEKLDTRVNEYLTKNNISFSDLKRFDISTINENGNVSSGGQTSTYHTYVCDVFLVYTLVIDKGNNNL